MSSLLPDRRPDEIRALARRAFSELGDAAGGIGSMHGAIADRAFGLSGPGAHPARVLHDAISGHVYTALRAGTGLAGKGADAMLGTRPPRGRTVSTTPRGAFALGVVTGLVGDALERTEPDLAEPMSVRVGGRVVDLERDALAEAFPDAAPRIVVFVHGLMGTEHGWRWFTPAGGETYGERLERELGATPVYVRFNTGRHISENGRSLHELLGVLVEQWPVGVEEIALVGHSMGGLVARSACHRAAEEHAPWAQRVRHVVSLGTPHMGAPMAQGVHVLAHALDRLPETRMFAGFLKRRSSGIRDLRYGSLVDEDWRDRDPDELRAAAVAEVPLLPDATHCFVAATITRSADHPLGRILGDTLVLTPSASGRSRTRTIPFRAEHGAQLGGATHFALLNHPAVADQLVAWLGTPPALAGAVTPDEDLAAPEA